MEAPPRLQMFAASPFSVTHVSHVTFQIFNMENYVPFQTSDRFQQLPYNVQEKFRQESDLLKLRLMQTDIISYFFTDHVRGPDVVRAYLETKHFQLFSPEDRQYGAAYFGLCSLFLVSKNFLNPTVCKNFHL